MVRKIDDFCREFTYEYESTLKLFRNLNDASLGFTPHPRVRSLGFLAWHITVTITEMMGHAGLTIDGTTQMDYHNESVAQILETYERSALSLLQQVKQQWSDADLETYDEMYGEKWKKGTTLSVLIRHQAHHRGQMLPLMHLAGLTVIGIYGPAAHEWEQMGMPAMK